MTEINSPAQKCDGRVKSNQSIHLVHHSSSDNLIALIYQECMLIVLKGKLEFPRAFYPTVSKSGDEQPNHSGIWVSRFRVIMGSWGCGQRQQVQPDMDICERETLI